MVQEERPRVRVYSYRKVWHIEKKIYAIQNIALPFPVNPYDFLEFCLVAGAMLLLGRIFPALKVIPGVLRYGALPYVVVRYLMKIRMDGKNPIKYFMGLIPYLFQKNHYQERFKTYKADPQRVRLRWYCGMGR